MSEIAANSDLDFNLNERRFDFSADSRVKETLLQSILSRSAAREPVSFGDLLKEERGHKPRAISEPDRLPRGLAPPGKGKDL